MNPSALLTLILWLALVLGLFHVVVRGTRAVVLAAQPLSGADTDAVVYHRSLFTPGSREVGVIWALLLLSAGLWWAWAALDQPRLEWPALLAFLAACGWEVWTWERVASSVKFVSWRRGWRQSTRRLPTAMVDQVSVAELTRRVRLGGLALTPAACRIELTMKDGAVVKLPTTAVLTSLGAVEQVANFVRMQVDVAQQAKREVEQERRHERLQEGKRPLSPQERALRKELLALRKHGAAPPATPASDDNAGKAAGPD